MRHYISQPDILMYGRAQQGKRLVVLLPDIRTSAKLLYEPLLERFRWYGSTVTVEYDRAGFNAQQTVHSVYEWLRRNGKSEICLVGTGLGGRLAIELSQHAMGSLDISGTIIIDAPSGPSDLVLRHRMQVLSWCRARPGLNRLAASALLRYYQSPPHDTNEVDVSLLAECDKYAHDYPPDSLLDQLRYLATPHGKDTAAHVITPTVLMHASQNLFVRRTATSFWQRLLKVDDSRIRDVSSPHAAIPQYPRVWIEVVTWALAELYGQ